MPFHRKASDADIVRIYQRTKSVHRTGKELSMSHASIHERLTKMGLMRHINRFTEDQDERLQREYQFFRKAGKLNILAKSMGRTRQFLCRQAKRLGLTSYGGPRKYSSTWKYMDQPTARLIMDEFKASHLNLKRFCKQRQISEVGFWKTMTRYFPVEWEKAIDAKKSADTTVGIGNRFEHATRNELRKRGYFAMLSPGSRSPIDVVAVKHGAVLFVQCKTGAAMGPKEWNALHDLSVSVGAVPVLASQLRPPTVEFHRMVGRKDGSRRRQPCMVYQP